jgi:hypothetical protein
MTIQKITNSLLYGVAADTKPTTYGTNTLFIETDTAITWTWNGTSWVIYEGASKTETLTNKTISGSSNTLSNIAAASLPATVVYTGQTNTFGAFDQVIPGGNLKLSASTFKTTVAATPTANRTITIPDATDTLVGKATTDTLTNKTLTSPNFSTIVNSGTITLPTATDTLVGLQTVDTLLNKTIVAASNTITDTSAATGDILKHNGTRFVRLARGSANQVLSTNGAGTDLVWATSSGGFTEAKGTSTQSGDASTTTFNIAHTLTGTPTWYEVTPGSQDAASNFWLTIGSTNITVNYTFPPPNVASNLVFNWRATT